MAPGAGGAGLEGQEGAVGAGALTAGDCSSSSCCATATVS